MANRKFTDIKDSKKDEEKLKQNEVTLDLPEVKDIPGQENIKVPKMNEMVDTTISSDDEEGVGILDEETNEVSSERIGSSTAKTEDDLIINEDEDAVEEELDEEDDVESKDEDLEITDDSVDEESDVSEDEKIALQRTADDVDSEDNEDLIHSELDDTDFDGDKLNEDIDVSGDDLDVPGAEEDDADEKIGEEDDANNSYSLGDNE